MSGLPVRGLWRIRQIGCRAVAHHWHATAHLAAARLAAARDATASDATASDATARDATAIGGASDKC